MSQYDSVIHVGHQLCISTPSCHSSAQRVNRLWEEALEEDDVVTRRVLAKRSNPRHPGGSRILGGKSSKVSLQEGTNESITTIFDLSHRSQTSIRSCYRVIVSAHLSCLLLAY